MLTNRNGDTIAIYRLDRPSVVASFIRDIKDGIEKGYWEFTTDLAQLSGSVFPDTVTPIAGLVQYYKRNSYRFNWFDIPEYLDKTSISEPLDAGTNIQQLTTAPLDRVWKFRASEDVNNIVNNLIREFSRTDLCASGVLDCLDWSLNEVMDNVLLHSEEAAGYVMAQIHKTTKHIAICVYDCGIGIYNTLKTTEYAPRSPIDAITLAIQEGVTRDKSVGQGNGMWGLHNIVRLNAGSLTIISNGGVLKVTDKNETSTTRIAYVSSEKGCTTVDFQIDYNAGTSLPDALGGHQPVRLRLEGLEDESGFTVYSLSERACGTGTRQSGQRVRNEIINIVNDISRPVAIDFSGIPVISSSFADEFLGKLVVHFGFAVFNQFVRLRNLNDTVSSIVDRSVTQRMTEAFAHQSQVSSPVNLAVGRDRGETIAP